MPNKSKNLFFNHKKFTNFKNISDIVEGSSPGNADTLIRSFPVAKLQKLDELISNPRWVIPVLPKGKFSTNSYILFHNYTTPPALQLCHTMYLSFPKTNIIYSNRRIGSPSRGIYPFE